MKEHIVWLTHSKVEVCGYTGASTRVPLPVPPTEPESMGEVTSVAEPAPTERALGLVGRVLLVFVAIVTAPA
jgi:hypothetical protein